MRPNQFITIAIRSVYGRDTIYPVDAAAKSFAAIAGTTTITVEALKHIRDLGYEVRCGRQTIPARMRPIAPLDFGFNPSPDWCPDCNARVDDQCSCERGL